MTKEQIYQTDPILRFLRDRLRLTPGTMLIVTAALAVMDLGIARVYNLWDARDGILGALHDPAYLLTMFVIIPLFLRTYVWMPDGVWGIFDGVRRNRLIREEDDAAYRAAMDGLAARYDRKWVVVALAVAAALQTLVVLGNLQAPPTYNTMLSLRQFLFRIPYGVLAIYGAASVIIHSALMGDWRYLFAGCEPQINPLHPDRAAGYGVFTRYTLNLLGIFVAVAVFIFTKFSYKHSPAGLYVPILEIKTLLSLALILLFGLVVMYLPIGAASRAMRRAKLRQLETIADGYFKEHEMVLSLLQPGAASESGDDRVKKHLDRLEQYRQARALVEATPNSPINREAFGRFGLSYLTIPMSTWAYNLFQFALGGNQAAASLTRLFATGTLTEIVKGLISLLTTGQIPSG